jgi:predicted TIM-barrel fold metal-dependent hydrolase
MINRRRFLAASGAGMISSGVALASSGLHEGIFSSARQRLAISETFTAPEWVEAFEATVAGTQNAADREFWRIFMLRPRESAAIDGDELRFLSLPAPGLEPFATEQARQLSIASNDRLSQIVRKSNGALTGLACISAFDRNAVQEAERAVTRLGLAGLSLGANRGMRLSDPQLWPLYEFAQSTRTPIYLPAAYSPGVGDAPYRAIRREGVIEGAARDSSSHAAQLIFGGVLDVFPRISFILARLGEATPHWYGELAAAKKGLDANDSRTPQRDISEYFRTNLFLTTADMLSPATLEFCSTALGRGRVLRSPENDDIRFADTFTKRLTSVNLDALRNPRNA